MHIFRYLRSFFFILILDGIIAVAEDVDPFEIIDDLCFLTKPCTLGKLFDRCLT